MRDHLVAGQIVQSMLAYGRLDDAFACLMSLEKSSAFPSPGWATSCTNWGSVAPETPGSVCFCSAVRSTSGRAALPILSW